eukprot:jgi/Mesvir1/2375/Mv22130-RA.2
MWVEGLEAALNKLAGQSFPFHKVLAVSGSGQQHGSVYWRTGALKSLQQMRADASLAAQLRNAFAIESPIWMDSSTTPQCRALEQVAGGAVPLAQLTGSTAKERFTGPQIGKIFEDHPDVYADVERISLVSSAMASVLVGAYASIDHSDAAGMNLMDIRRRSWSPPLVQFIAPDLERRLGPLAPAHAPAGPIHRYFVDKYGFSPSCDVINWSGDNPCSLAGLGLEQVGDLSVSLGTSDTVFGVVQQPHPGRDSMVLPNPVDPTSYMTMLVYKNGSLAREEVRDRCAGGSWDTFNAMLARTPAGNGGSLGLYYPFTEITPFIQAGVYRYAPDPLSSGALRATKHFDEATEVRAIIESQALAMRLHAERAGMPSPPQRLVATGGASANRSLLQVLANVFGCEVFTADTPDSAPLGAALRALQGWLSLRGGEFVEYKEVLGAGTSQGPAVWKSSALPDMAAHLVYTELLGRRAHVESTLVGEK